MKFSDLAAKSTTVHTPQPVPPTPQPPPPPPPPKNPFAALRQTMQESATPATPAPAPVKPKPVANTVDAIANMEVGDDEVLAMGEFPGQLINATAPLTEQLQQRLNLLSQTTGAQLDSQLTEAKLFLDKNPELHDLLKPEDITIFVRALRSVYGTVIAKKQENKSKRRVSSAQVEETTGELEDLGF